MPFETEFTVAFNDIDAAGIVYFGNVFDYCHRAYERLLEAASLPLSHILANENWAMPLVHAEADYKHPMRHGERITIRVELLKVGRSAIHFRYDLLGSLCQPSRTRPFSFMQTSAHRTSVPARPSRPYSGA